MKGSIRALLYAGPIVLVLTLDSLTGLDAATGRKVWQQTLRSVSTDSDIAIVQGVAYLCGDDGLLGVDVATGQRRWSLAAKADVVFNCVGGVRDGALYATVFNQQSQRREVWCVDMASGALRWATPCGSDDTLLSLPAGGSFIYVYGPGSGSGSGFAALDIGKKGAGAWSRTADSGAVDPAGIVVTDSGLLAAFGSDHTVVGLDPATGSTIWQSPPLGDANSSPGFLQIFTPGGDVYYAWDGAKLSARRTGNAGTELWSTPLKGPDFALNTEVVFDESSLYFIGDALYELDSQTGRTRSRHTVSGPFPLSVDTRLAAGGGGCYVEGGDGVVGFPAG